MKRIFKNQTAFFIAAFLVVLLVLAFSIKNNKKTSRNWINPLRPAMFLFSSIGWWTNEKLDFISSIGELKNENEKLAQENLFLKGKVAQMNEIEKENKELREALKLNPRDKFELISALVIAKEINNKNVIIINRGNQDGIEKDSGVVVGENVLIGRIKEVYEKTAAVELLTSSEIKISAETQETGAKGIVGGEFETSVVMDMISQAVQLNKGDSVITSGGSSFLPRGLLIGYVREVFATADQLFQKATLEPPIEYEKLRFVWVIKGEKSNKPQ